MLPIVPLMDSVIGLQTYLKSLRISSYFNHKRWCVISGVFSSEKERALVLSQSGFFVMSPGLTAAV